MFWTVLCLNGSVIQPLFWHTFLILLPGSAVKSGFHSFLFLHNFKDTVPPSEACLHGCINWSLTQAMYLPVPLTVGRRGSVQDSICDVLQSTTSSTLSSYVMKVDTLPKLLDQWRSIIYNRFVLNIVKGHHLQLRYHPILFHIFKWCNIKAAKAHHPIIQKEVDEPLANGAIELSTGRAGLYSDVFVVPKCTCDL